MPGISVIIPVYQAEKYLEKCVQSVRKQTFSDWELLLVDDGSRDGSGALCDRLAKEDKRIRVFHQRNGGVSTARNRGLKEAKGTCIAFLDVDDRYEFRCLETLWNARESSGADTAACAHLNLWPDGTKRTELCLPAGTYDADGIRSGIVAPLLGDRLVPPLFNGFIWRYLYSAELIRQNGLAFEGAYLEDELFLLEYFCCARKLVVTEEPLYRYFLNPASATHRYMADYPRVFARFLERKEALARKYALTELRPQWREHTCWAGLLIAVANAYAPGSKDSARKRQKEVEALCARPEFSAAIAALKPERLSASKQLVANLVRGKHFFILTQLYRLKNGI